MMRVPLAVQNKIEDWMATQPDKGLTLAEAARRMMELGLALSRILPGAPPHKIGRPLARRQRSREYEDAANAYDF